MQTNRILKTLSAVVLCAMAAGCVPTSKYQQAQQATRDNARKVEERDVQIAQLRDKIAQLGADYDALRAKEQTLEGDTALAGVRNRTLNNRLAVLENDLRALAAKMGDVPEYRSLMNHLNQMQDELASSNDRLLDSQKRADEQRRRLDEAQSALQQSENALQQSAADLAVKSQQIQDQQLELASARRDIEDQAARLREMEAALRAKDQAMTELKNKIANALGNFKSDELTVEHKNGRVYVSLEEKLLFASGQWEVENKGVSAIRQIASVLKNVDEEIDITVEGHTDNVPLRGTVIQDNWDLSAKRATSVVRLLVSGGVSATRVQASGRGDTQPVATNDSEEGRRKNRRIEIVLTPKLEQILKAL